MTNTTVDQLIEKAQEYLHLISSFAYYQVKERNNILVLRSIGLGLLGLSNVDDAVSENSRSDNPLNWEERLIVRDSDTLEVPFLLANDLLKNVSYGKLEIQTLLDRTTEFKKYSPDTFASYGTFLSVMIATVIEQDGELSIDTKNGTPSYNENWFRTSWGISSYPLNGLEQMNEFYRDHSLISNLGSHLSKGKLNVKGNVGSFFGSNNNGAHITLEGDCGWRACYEMWQGQVTLKGTVAPELATYSRNGRIDVEGILAGGEVGDYYTVHNKHSIYHKGVLIPKRPSL